MNIWEIHTKNRLIIISDTSNFDVSYMKDAETTFTKFDNIQSYGDNLYTIDHTFDELGTYIIKLQEPGGLVRYNQLSVVDKAEFDFMKTNTKYNNSFEGASLVFEENKGN